MFPWHIAYVIVRLLWSSINMHAFHFFLHQKNPQLIWILFSMNVLKYPWESFHRIWSCVVFETCNSSTKSTRYSSPDKESKRIADYICLSIPETFLWEINVCRTGKRCSQLWCRSNRDSRKILWECVTWAGLSEFCHTKTRARDQQYMHRHSPDFLQNCRLIYFLSL